jgi:hypothetical protein
VNWYVLSDGDKPIGMLVHEYSTGHFSVHTKSKAFQVSVDNAVQFFKSSHFLRSGQSLLKACAVSSTSVNWIDLILSKICTDPWKVSEQGELVTSTGLESLVSSKIYA